MGGIDVRLSKLIGEIGAKYDWLVPKSGQAHRLLRRAGDEFTQWIPAGHLVEGYGGDREPVATPIITIFNSDETTTIRHGLHVAYLFAEDKSTVTLTLNQGVGEMAEHLGRARARTVLARQAATIRAALRPEDIADLDVTFDLHTMAASSVDHEHANIVSRTYSLDSLPGESEMIADLQRFIRLYALAREAREVARRQGRHEQLITRAAEQPAEPDITPPAKPVAEDAAKPDLPSAKPAAKGAAKPDLAPAKPTAKSVAKPDLPSAKPVAEVAAKPGLPVAKPAAKGAAKPDLPAAKGAAKPDLPPAKGAAKPDLPPAKGEAKPDLPSAKPAAKSAVKPDLPSAKPATERAPEPGLASPGIALEVLVPEIKVDSKRKPGSMTRRGILAALVVAPLAYAAPKAAASRNQNQGFVTKTPLRTQTSPVFTIDVSQHDWKRRGGNLDWTDIRRAGIAGMCARATYGDPSGYQWPTYYFANFSRGAKEAGIGLRGGYHNLVRGDQPSINRQVDWLRRELDRHDANWAMLDIERYSELIKAEMWPTWDDVRRFDDRWAEVDERVLVGYLPPWNWSKHLGQPDLRDFRGPLIASNYPREANEDFKELYDAIGGNDGRGWAEYGYRTPEGWQYSSKAKVPGAAYICDVNAWRITFEELQKLLAGTQEAA